jgi:hypothetical protein
MSNEFGRKEAVVTYSMYCPRIYLEGPTETTIRKRPVSWPKGKSRAFRASVSSVITMSLSISVSLYSKRY